jgi:peptidyl-prolyl cis-trans isomerase B (cyclophilin B)
LKTSIDADKKKEGLKMAQIVKITMENGNQIRVELDPVQAPITVANFVKLIEDGFYNGLIFHRVIPGFMIQGGCPDGTGMGGPGWQIKGEFKRNGVNNEIQHTRGVISMARSMMPDSAGSQFFIMHQDSPHLDGQYAAFGHVIEGIETVDAIAAVKTGAGDRPVEEQKIAKIEIEV